MSNKDATDFPDLSGYRFERAFTCARCAVFKGIYATTFSKRDALMHLVEAHPHKLVEALGDEGLIQVTDIELEQILVDSRGI